MEFVLMCVAGFVVARIWWRRRHARMDEERVLREYFRHRPPERWCEHCRSYHPSTTPHVGSSR